MRQKTCWQVKWKCACACMCRRTTRWNRRMSWQAGGQADVLCASECYFMLARVWSTCIRPIQSASQPASLYTCMCQLTVKPQQPNMAGRRRKKPPKKNTTNQQIDRYVWTCCGSSQMMIDGTLHTVKWLNSIFFWPVVDNSNLTMFIFIFSSSLNDDDDNIYNG